MKFAIACLVAAFIAAEAFDFGEITGTLTGALENVPGGDALTGKLDPGSLMGKLKPDKPKGPPPGHKKGHGENNDNGCTGGKCGGTGENDGTGHDGGTGENDGSGHDGGNGCTKCDNPVDMKKLKKAQKEVEKAQKEVKKAQSKVDKAKKKYVEAKKDCDDNDNSDEYKKKLDKATKDLKKAEIDLDFAKKRCKEAIAKLEHLKSL